MQLTPVFSAFSSAYQEVTKLFTGGEWGSASRRTCYAEALLSGVCALEKIILPWAGSDITSHRARIVLRLRNPDGGYHDFKVWENTIIGRGYQAAAEEIHFSNDGDPTRENYRPMKAGYEL